MLLWLCIRLPQLAREARAGQPRPAAERSEKDLLVQRAALERLAAWAYQWSSLISYAPSEPLLWLELGASCALFDGHAALLAKIEAELVQLGYSHVCALAPSPTAAALLTRATGARHALTQAQLRAQLEPLPLQLLDLPAPILTALRASGLRRIGEVLELPAAAIARRFEPETLLYLQRLCGKVSDPRPAWCLPPTYRSRCEFGLEVRTSTALLFPLRRLLLEFQGYLRARDCSVQRFTLEFEHYRHPGSRVSIGLSAAGRDAAQFLTLVRERLHSLALPAPVRALRLEALEFTSPTIVQTDLFGNDAQPLQQLQRLLDRLRARLGEDSVQALELAADYRPERGWRFLAPERSLAGGANGAGSSGADSSGAGSHSDAPPRPCWLLLEPVRIEAPTQLLRGPERLESGWWDGEDVGRDYYLARTGEGSQIWVFHDRRAGHWYLQGLWA
ncbi:MAG TPA: DNA polymerase Y family protein [Steroidobacteraceae bacterium]|jgi:protein ImuB|nr:DNA polymerase Y family protein [Steroidobacteraceae bacterium]